MNVAKDNDVSGLVVYHRVNIQSLIVICDMIKMNESDVGNIVFEILAKTVFKFLCFTMFLSLANSS